jgi:TatD DNase family protein
MYVDSHCHLEIEEFEADRDQVIQESLAGGLVYILTVGTEERYFDAVKEMAERYREIFGAVGIHPHNAKEYGDSARRALVGALTHHKIVALGEIGLDFFKNHSPRDAQITAFEGQMDLAGESGLPIIVHSRDSREETLALLEAWARRFTVKGVIHCFSYDLDTARKLLDMGFYLSIPGTITYTKNTGLIDVVRYIPLDRILAETDAPFLSPQPHRGKRNVPHYVKITVDRIAMIKNMDVEKLVSSIHGNFESLFLRDPKGVML